MTNPGKLFIEEGLVDELHGGNHTPQTSLRALSKTYYLLIIRAEIINNCKIERID